MSDFSWPRRAFLNRVGLNHRAGANGKLHSVQLAEAAVDPRTGGAVAVATDAEMDGHDGVKSIKTLYWRMLPSGEQVSAHLFDIELTQGESYVHTAGGNTVKVPTMVPRSVWVLGRKVYDEKDAGEPPPGLIDNLSLVMKAVGEVNKAMRYGNIRGDGKRHGPELPEVAKIFKECNVSDAIGENLLITGQSAGGGFNFDAPDVSGKAGGKLTVPDVVARALMGLDVNTLDHDRKLGPENPRVNTDPRSGKNFKIEAHVDNGKDPLVSTAITPSSLSGIKTTLDALAIQADDLSKSIESDAYNPDQKAAAFAAISQLVPDYKGAGNAIKDKAFIQSLQEKYCNQPDPFLAALMDAQSKIDNPDHPLKKEQGSIPQLTHGAWKSDGVDDDGRPLSTLDKLHLLGEDMTSETQLKRMRALGVKNRILHDVRAGDYPHSMDHLVEYDLHRLVSHFERPPPLSDGGRLSMISVGGNNMEKVSEGFGETIGGNSKVIYHEGLNQDQKIDKVGIIVDLGLHLSPKDEANNAAAPDVVEHLEHCKDILLTHRHLDHTDGLFVYMQYGLLKGKTVHATPEVIRSLEDKMPAYGIRKDDLRRPAFHKLTGEGWLHIKDKEGKTRLSVNYARNATPHSARTTPFFVHGHYDGKWIGSYLNPGDARYGSHNRDNYKGPEIDTDHLNKKFFTESSLRLVEELPDLKNKDVIATRGPTYFDMDVTSITKKGWAPTEHQVENNLSEISDWFKDKGMLLAMISTNENRFETALRVGTRVHRDITVFGANLQKTATALNILGVNDLRHEPDEDGKNIQRYLDKIFEERLEKKIASHRAEMEKASSVGEQQKIQEKIDRHEARLTAFQKLKGIRHASARYNERVKLEADLEQRFGTGKATLGSLIEGKETENSLGEEEKGLGAIHVGRTSQTSKRIMSMDDDSDTLPGSDGRRLLLLTGTQGSNVEVDSALSALAKGHHSSLDGNPKNNPNARPIIPENNVVVISQTAIPGNGEKQAELVRKLVGRGFTVVQAMHDKFKIHNVDAKRREKIIFAVKAKNLCESLASNDYNAAQKIAAYEAIKKLMPNSYVGSGNPLENNNFIEGLQANYSNQPDPFEAFLTDASKKIAEKSHPFKKESSLELGKTCELPKVEDNSLEVYGMPIHAGGHGHRKDCEAWVKLVKADVVAAQHTSDPQAGLDLDKVCKDVGRKYMGRIVPNFEGLSINAGDGPGATNIHSIGKIPDSHIRVEISRKTRQYFGGYTKAWRVVKDEPGLRADWLGATRRPGGWYETAFANIDAEKDVKQTVERDPISTDPDPENTQPPVEPHRYQGAINPAKWKSQLRRLGQSEALPSAAFASAGR